MEIKQITRNKNEKYETFLGRINKMLAEATPHKEKKKYYKELLAHRVTNIIKLPMVLAEKEPYIFPVKIKKPRLELVLSAFFNPFILQSSHPLFQTPQFPPHKKLPELSASNQKHLD